jgi:biotin carboxyl carrier protein
LLLQLQDLEVRFKRSAGNAIPPPPPAAAAPVQSSGPLPMMVDFPAMADAPSGSLSSMDMSSSADDSENFSVVGVTSEKVGVFRRCKYVNTKKLGNRPMVEEGAEVKQRQQLAFIEQLGTYSPVEVRPGLDPALCGHGGRAMCESNGHIITLHHLGM